VTALRQSVVDPIVELASRVAVLEAEMRRLRCTKGPRDRLDVALVAAILDAAGARPWRCGDVLIRAESVPALRAALQAAEVTSAKGLGKLAARLDGIDVAGLRLERVQVRGRPHWRIVSSV
jgi:hypothetical protein